MSKLPIISALLLLSGVGGCDRNASRPRLDSRTEAIVMERWLTAPAGDAVNLWAELERTLGPGESISFDDFLDVTGYDFNQPEGVECRI